jgi:hypothetical protein
MEKMAICRKKTCCNKYEFLELTLMDDPVVESHADTTLAAQFSGYGANLAMVQRALDVIILFTIEN